MECSFLEQTVLQLPRNSVERETLVGAKWRSTVKLRALLQH